MVGLYIAATIVSLVQFVRVRDKRVLLLVALFAFQAQSLNRDWLDPWKNIYQSAACIAGLLLVVALTLRPHPPVEPHVAAAPVSAARDAEAAVPASLDGHGPDAPRTTESAAHAAASRPAVD